MILIRMVAVFAKDSSCEFRLERLAAERAGCHNRGRARSSSTPEPDDKFRAHLHKDAHLCKEGCCLTNASFQPTRSLVLVCRLLQVKHAC